jgi:hypothetical protein
MIRRTNLDRRLISVQAFYSKSAAYDVLFRYATLMASQKVQYLRCAAFPGICDALILELFALPSQADFLLQHQLWESKRMKSAVCALHALDPFAAAGYMESERRQPLSSQCCTVGDMAPLGTRISSTIC